MKKVFIKNTISFLLLVTLCLPMTTLARHTINSADEKTAFRHAVKKAFNIRATNEGLIDQLAELEVQRKRASSDIDQRIWEANTQYFVVKKDFLSQIATLSDRHDALVTQTSSQAENAETLQREISETEDYLRAIQARLQEHETSHEARLSGLAREIVEALSPYEPQRISLTQRQEVLEREAEEEVVALVNFYNGRIPAAWSHL